MSDNTTPDVPVGYAVSQDDGSFYLTTSAVQAGLAVELFDTPQPYAYRVDGALQWEQPAVGGAPVFARRLVAPRSEWALDDYAGRTLAKLRTLLEVKELDMGSTLEVAVVRVKRLTAELDNLRSTGTVLSPEVVARVRQAIGTGEAGLQDLRVLDVHLLLNAVAPEQSVRLPAQAPAGDVVQRAARYEHLRTLSPVQFAALFQKNLQTGVPFDQLVDEDMGSRPVTAFPDIKHPLLGSEAWFAALGPSAIGNAVKYVSAHHRVEVQHTNDSGPWLWVVAFVGTDFWADAFDQQDLAEAFAFAWNEMSEPPTIPAQYGKAPPV